MILAQNRLLQLNGNNCANTWATPFDTLFFKWCRLTIHWEKTLIIYCTASTLITSGTVLSTVLSTPARKVI